MTRFHGSLFLILIAALLISGCGDDSATPTTPAGTGSHINFADYAAIIENIAPPVYQQPTLKPMVIDPMWNTGDYSLLGKVFSENEPMSLYSNLNTFDNLVAEIELILQTDDEGNFTFDTNQVTLTELSSATTLPTYAQGLMGTSVNVANWLDMHYDGMDSNMVIHLGFTKTATEEVILMFFQNANMDVPGYFESSLYFASYDPTDSSIALKGVFYKETSDTTSARWVYDIHSVNESDFAYRMSWYADRETPEMQASLLGCIIGGGNKDTEFALRYRQYMPADSAVMDSNFVLDQVFGADYAEGTGLISAYDEFVDEALIIGYDEMPETLLTSPWGTR